MEVKSFNQFLLTLSTLCPAHSLSSQPLGTYSLLENIQLHLEWLIHCLCRYELQAVGLCQGEVLAHPYGHFQHCKLWAL